MLCSSHSGRGCPWCWLHPGRNGLEAWTEQSATRSTARRRRGTGVTPPERDVTDGVTVPAAETSRPSGRHVMRKAVAVIVVLVATIAVGTSAPSH